MGEQEVFPLVSGSDGFRLLLKLKMGTPLTSEIERPCSFIHPFLPLCSSGAQAGAGLGCGFFFPPPPLQLVLKIGTSRDAMDSWLSVWHFLPSPGPAVTGNDQQRVRDAEDLLFPWMWVPPQKELVALPSLSMHCPSEKAASGQHLKWVEGSDAIFSLKQWK